MLAYLFRVLLTSFQPPGRSPEEVVRPASHALPTPSWESTQRKIVIAPSLSAAQVTLVHFGAVVSDAPSPLSTPRSAAGQAQLRLGKPLRMKCRASPVLLFMRAGRVVAGSVGIVRATVPFHGEHDALEPTK